MTDDKFLTPEEASTFLQELGCPRAPSTLAKLRVIGGGPVFQKWGRKPVYTSRRLREFADRQISPEMTSTASRRRA